MENREPGLGDGIYTAADAARILRIPFKKSKDWFQYYVKHRLFDTVGYRYYYDISDVVAVDFLSLITMAVFFGLKSRPGVTGKQIIKVHQNMAKQFDTPYPFAREDIYTIGNKIFFGSEKFLIRGDTLQPTLPNIFLGFAEKIEFDDKKLANKYYPLGKDRSIVVAPENQMGIPIIDGTNILADTIYDYVLGGDKRDFIAKLFGITVRDVEDVIEFSRAA